MCGLQSSARNLVEVHLAVHAMFMAPAVICTIDASHLHGMSGRAARAHVPPASAAKDHSVDRKAARQSRRSDMLKKTGWVSAALALAAFSTLASVSLTSPAQAAVVYCKTAGVPQGCVVRPTAAVAVVAAPRVRVATVGVARVGVGARGVGVRPGTAWNRGGPVNRIGRR
jgi:hypothetical protein